MIDPVSERALRALRGMLWGDGAVADYTRFLEEWGWKIYAATSVREAQRYGLLRDLPDPVLPTPEATAAVRATMRALDAAFGYKPESSQMVRDYIESIRLDASHRVTELAGSHAQSIVRTHDQMLADRAAALARDNPSWPWSAIRTSLIAYDDSIAAWKAQQVNETERYAFFQAAFEDFYRDNSDLAALFEFGGSLQCPLCAAVADANPYTLQAMIDVPDPLHIGCLDSWSPV